MATFKVLKQIDLDPNSEEDEIARLIEMAKAAGAILSIRVMVKTSG